MTDLEFKQLEEKYLREKERREQLIKSKREPILKEIKEINNATNYNGWVDLYDIQIRTKQSISLRQDGNGDYTNSENIVNISEKVLFVKAMESYIYALMVKYGIVEEDLKSDRNG